MVDEPSVARLLASVLAAGPGTPLPQRLCERAMASLGVDALAVTVLSTPDHRHVVHATDSDVMLVEDVQLTLGDGPVVEAFRDGRAVLVPDLTAEAQSRWPLFGEASGREPRYAGAFAFPLTTGTAPPIGVMGMYTRARRHLDEAAVEEARVIAHAMTLAVLHPADLGGVGDPGDPVDPGRAGRADPAGQQHDDALRAAVTLPDRGTSSWDEAEQVVYQAVGMIVVQLHVSPAAALARLRAHAFADAATLDEVAMAVVERRLRLEV